jgi:protein-L-isoaspartate(D-aspartate) O-methyltransferase
LGDGHLGYLPNSPYDAVIITAAAESIPDNLISQISEKGRMVLPLIDNKNQKLVKLKNTKNGIIKKTVEDVFFVPLLPGIEINE